MLLALGLLVAPLAGRGLAGSAPGGAAPPPERAARALELQPFFRELTAIREGWGSSPLQQVVGDSPRATLLRFYAVMAEVDQRSQLLISRQGDDPGPFWSSRLRQQIRGVDGLLRRAGAALDLSLVPER